MGPYPEADQRVADALVQAAPGAVFRIYADRSRDPATLFANLSAILTQDKGASVLVSGVHRELVDLAAKRMTDAGLAPRVTKNKFVDNGLFKPGVYTGTIYQVSYHATDVPFNPMRYAFTGLRDTLAMRGFPRPPKTSKEMQRCVVDWLQIVAHTEGVYCNLSQDTPPQRQRLEELQKDIDPFFTQEYLLEMLKAFYSESQPTYVNVLLTQIRRGTCFKPRYLLIDGADSMSLLQWEFVRNVLYDPDHTKLLFVGSHTPAKFKYLDVDTSNSMRDVPETQFESVKTLDW